MPTLVKAYQNKNEIGGPSKEKRAHEPMAELDDVIDLITVLRSVHRLTEELIDEREATHIPRDFLPPVLRAVRAVYARVARDENRTHRLRRART